jgi:hypothetical protein
MSSVILGATFKIGREYIGLFSFGFFIKFETICFLGEEFASLTEHC